MAIQSNFPAIKPSLLLDFANTKQLDPRITFTRASTATYYDGVTTTMAEQNLWTYSQDFDDASWLKLGASITANATTAPDGTTTADSLVSTATPASVYLTRTPTLTASQPYVISFYVKANTANFIQIITASAIVPSGYVNFNVTSGAGAIGNYGGTGITPSIVDVGNGWYRCILTIASVAGSGVIEFHLVDSATAARSATYSGTIGTGVYIWGSQLENRSAITAYTATTTQAITNYIPKLQTAASGVARFDNNPTTGESLGLLIEEQRANLVTYSSQFDNAAWTLGGSTITANIIIAPDGTLTSDKIIANASAGVSPSVYQAITVSTSTAYTWSVYAKAGEYSYLMIKAQDTTSGTNPTWFNLANGTIGTNSSGNTSTITSVGNGWYKCTVTRTPSATTGYINIQCANADNTSTLTGNGYSGIYIWGAQLEAGAFATSYIPTVASQVTRSADAASMTGTNFSSWYNQGEGTVYFETLTTTAGTDKYNFEIGDGTANNRISALSQSSNQDAYVIVNGSVVANANLAISRASSIRGAIGFKVNDIRSAFNGSLGAADTSATIPSVNALYLGSARSALVPLNGTIAKIAYYPLRVTNAQLQALTS